MLRKEIITILAVSVLGVVQFAMATQVDSNSIIKDDIEYYMQTDKFTYNLGENVEMLYRVTNLRDEDVTFEFTVGPADDRCDFMVDRDGQRIWDNLNRPSFDVGTSFTLGPSELMNFYWSWDMTNFDDEQVIPGLYDVTGALGNLRLSCIDKYVPVSVQIEIVPEPASLLLLGTGLAGFLAYNEKRKK